MSDPTHIGPTSGSFDVSMKQRQGPSEAAKHREERARQRQAQAWWRRLLARLRKVAGQD